MIADCGCLDSRLRMSGLQIADCGLKGLENTSNSKTFQLCTHHHLSAFRSTLIATRNRQALYFSNNNRFGFAYGCAGLTAQAVLRPHRDRLVRHFEHLYRTIFDTLLAGVAALRINVNQIDLIVSRSFGHVLFPFVGRGLFWLLVGYIGCIGSVGFIGCIG
jgi:hypothetical protein